MEQEQINQIERTLSRSRFVFAIKCMHKVMQITARSNTAFSPHSIYEGLLLAYFMSSGAIEERLKLILYLKDVSKYDLIQYYSSRRDSEQSENNASVASTDYDDERRCWIKPTKFNHLLPLKNIFNNGLEVFDPDNTSTEKMNRINMALESAVKNHIFRPLHFGEVKDDMELVLMTVSLLNVQKFQISTTCQSDASYVLGDKRRSNNIFSHELNMHVIEFPYTNENRSLFVFLPGSISLSDCSDRSFPRIDNDAICNLIERLWSEEAICALSKLLNSDIPPSEDCFLKGPTFEVERNLPMRAVLQHLYAEHLLKPDAINLDSFFVDDDSVHLGNAVSRTHVKVTEEDTVAGSVNVIYTGQEDYLVRGSFYRINSRKSNFPFVWLIYDKQRRNILFAGASYNLF